MASFSVSRQRWPPCSTQSSWQLWGARGIIRVHMGAGRCRKEGERCTPNSFPSLLCWAALTSREWPSWAGETQWGVPQPWEGTLHTSHPPAAATASCHLTFPPTPKPCLLTFASRLNWRRNMVAAAVGTKRSRARKTKNKRNMSRAGSSSPWIPIRGAWYDVCLTRVPGMGVLHQKRRRFSLHAKNASLTAQLSNPHQHFLWASYQIAQLRNTQLQL